MNSQPLYYHEKTGLTQYIVGTSIKQRDAARRLLERKVVNSGGNPLEIEYRAGFGPATNVRGQ